MFFPGSYFLFNWKSEIKTQGESGGHQDITEAECDLSWQLDINVTPIVRGPKLITGLPPPSNSVSTPPSKAPTNIWIEQPLPDPPSTHASKARQSKQGKARRALMSAVMIAQEQRLKDEKAERIRQQEQEKKDVSPLHVAIDYKFAMSCPLFDSEERAKKIQEMTWKLALPRTLNNNIIMPGRNCCSLDWGDIEPTESDWMKTNPIAWKLFVQNLQDVLRCFS